MANNIHKDLLVWQEKQPTLDDQDIREVDRWCYEGYADAMRPYIEKLLYELQFLRNLQKQTPKN